MVTRMVSLFVGQEVTLNKEALLLWLHLMHLMEAMTCHLQLVWLNLPQKLSYSRLTYSAILQWRRQFPSMWTLITLVQVQLWTYQQQATLLTIRSRPMRYPTNRLGQMTVNSYRSTRFKIVVTTSSHSINRKMADLWSLLTQAFSLLIKWQSKSQCKHQITWTLVSTWSATK